MGRRAKTDLEDSLEYKALGLIKSGMSTARIYVSLYDYIRGYDQSITINDAYSLVTWAVGVAYTAYGLKGGKTHD